MSRTVRLTALTVLITILATPIAYADLPDPGLPVIDGDTVTAETHSDPIPGRTADSHPRHHQHASSGGPARLPSHSTGDSADKNPVSEKQRKIDEALAEYEQKLAIREECLRWTIPRIIDGAYAPFCFLPEKPDLGDTTEVAPDTADDKNKAPAAPTITPEQAGQLAVAQLTLPVVAPGIGPSRDLNQWGIAAVGYPYWLWADGPTHIGPVSQSVAKLSVSLEADVHTMKFDMGDGHTVTCHNAGTPWTKRVKPGAKSPTCGYTYTEPSKPDHPYKITAVTYWSVHWQINGSSGVIEVPRSESMTLPVGELQVLVH